MEIAVPFFEDYNKLYVSAYRNLFSVFVIRSVITAMLNFCIERKETEQDEAGDLPEHGICFETYPKLWIL